MSIAHAIVLASTSALVVVADVDGAIVENFVAAVLIVVIIAIVLHSQLRDIPVIPFYCDTLSVGGWKCGSFMQVSVKTPGWSAEQYPGSNSPKIHPKAWPQKLHAQNVLRHGKSLKHM